MLALKGGIGASLIKNKPVTDLTGEVGLWFVNRGYIRHQFYSSYNLYFFYDSGNDMRLNSMVNLGYPD
ncbi:MAG: hypothetical protein HC905_06785 [Bacteroidales bacterium]|nr:hypothetical protein [Bacteroidales bacterium]